MENMFERATRGKVRYETPKGYLSVEDLWDLPLTSRTNKANLDDIARGLNKQLKETDEESFVVKRRSENEEVRLKFDIVKYIIDVRLQENEEADKKAAIKQKKERLLTIIAQKEDEQLLGTSLDELKAMAESL